MAAKRILVVDPDEAVAALLASILEEEGYKVATAHSLHEAIVKLSSSQFDLIITEAFGQRRVFDFDPEFLAELRSTDSDAPIVLCSTYPSTDWLHAGDFDLAEVVPKPFEIDDVVRTVKRVLGEAMSALNGSR